MGERGKVFLFEFLEPEDGRSPSPLKSRYLFINPDFAISQKTRIFTTITVRTKYLAQNIKL